MNRLMAFVFLLFPFLAYGQDTVVLAKRLDPDAVVKIPANDYLQVVKIRLLGGRKYFAVLTGANDSFYFFRTRDDATMDTAAMNAFSRKRMTMRNRDSIQYHYHQVLFHKELRVRTNSLQSIMVKDNWKQIPKGLRIGLTSGFFIVAGTALFLPPPFSFAAIASAGGVYLTGYLLANRNLDLKKKWYLKKVIRDK